MKRRLLLMVLLLVALFLSTGCLALKKPVEDDDVEERVLFAPKFESAADLSGWQTLGDSFYVILEGEGSGSLANTTSKDSIIYYTEFSLPETFRVSARMRMPDRGAEESWWIGFAFFVNDSEIHVVRWRASSGGAIQSNIYKWENDSFVMKSPGYSAGTLSQAPPAGEFVEMCVEKSADSVVITINGITAGTGDSTTFPYVKLLPKGARIGFYTVSGDPAYFKDLKVEKL